MQVQAHVRPESAKCSSFGRQNLIQIGIARKDVAEAPLHHNCQAEVGAAALQNIHRGRRENAISQRPEPENGQPAVSRQTF